MCSIFLQRLKLSSQGILLIGISITVTAYLLLTDWQAIPYDPCTEHSPFHHPEIIKNQSKNVTSTTAVSLDYPKLFNEVKLGMTSEIKLQFEGGMVLHSSENMGFIAKCRLNSSCSLCDSTILLPQEVQPCLVLENNSVVHVISSEKNVNALQFSCSSDDAKTFCININTQGIHHFEKKDHNPMTNGISAYLQYSLISNSCIKADVPGRKCHWIPFSTVSNSVCNDCPPICRAKEQTLNIVQFSLGLFALLISAPILWMPLMAIATDFSPKQFQVCQLQLWYVHNNAIY